jgi:uncharacterized membrane protein (UPF0127 family)
MSKLFKGYRKVKMNIKGKMYSLWVADTPAKKSLGLSQVKKLPYRTGMIFIYDTLVDHNFTMKNTRIPLTIVFLDDKMRVIDSFNCRPFYNKSINPGEPYKYVVEI